LTNGLQAHQLIQAEGLSLIKDFVIRNDRHPLEFTVHVGGGGRMPEALKGVYNKRKIAYKAIEDYLKGKNNGKSTKRSK